MAHKRPERVDWTTMLTQLQQKVKTQLEEETRSKDAEAKKILQDTAEKILGGPPPYTVQYYTASSPNSQTIELQESSDLASLVTALETTSSIMSQRPSKSTMQTYQNKFVVIPVEFRSKPSDVILIENLGLTKLGNLYDKYMETLEVNDPRRDAWRNNMLIVSLKKALVKHRSTSEDAQIADIKELEIHDERQSPHKDTKIQIDCSPDKVQTRRGLLEPKLSVRTKPEQREDKRGLLALKYPKETKMQMLCDALASSYVNKLPIAKGDDIFLPLGTQWFALLSHKSKDATRNTELYNQIQSDKLKKDFGPFKTKLKKLQEDRQTRWASKEQAINHTVKSNTLKLWDDETTLKVETIKNSVKTIHDIRFSELSKLDLENVMYYDILTNGTPSMITSDTYLVGLIKPHNTITNIILGSPRFGRGISLSFVGAYVLWASKEKLSKYDIFKDPASTPNKSLSAILAEWSLEYKGDTLHSTDQFQNVKAEITDKQLQLYSVSETEKQDFWNIFTWGELKLHKISSSRFVYACVTGMSDPNNHNAMISKKRISPGMFDFGRPYLDRTFQRFIIEILEDVSTMSPDDVSTMSPDDFVEFYE
jgi:hypothetical protein